MRGRNSERGPRRPRNINDTINVKKSAPISTSTTVKVGE
jgi:hypothetical protein